MNELLNLANKLIDARENAPEEPWENGKYTLTAGDGKSIFYDDERLNASSEFIVLVGNHAVDVIQGYQELIRRMADILDECVGHLDDSNSELISRGYEMFAEARASIPKDVP